jgi:opacity protein-like surface antigen
MSGGRGIHPIEGGSIMKRMLWVLVLGLAVVSQAEEWRSNNTGVLFSFSGLDNLGVNAYQAGSNMTGLGVKMFNAAGNKALRPMVVFNTSSTTHEPSMPNWVGQKTSSTSFGLLVDGIQHLVKASISPFIGVGVGFGTSSSKTESDHSTTGKPDVTEESSTGFGIRAILGVEVFIKKNISLSGEYRLGYTHTSTTSSFQAAGSTTKTESKVKETTIGIGASGLLTLSIYVN